MIANGKYIFKKILVVMVWILLCAGTVVLLIAAITRKNNEHCAKIEVSISGVQNNFFIDKKDVLDVLQKTSGGNLRMKPLYSIDLASMETELQKSQWIKKAELYFDNNNTLQVKIKEREPIARIFTATGLSFYMDSSLARLPLSDKFSARLPVFTNFPTDVIFSKADSNLIKDIRTLGEFIGNDPFWMAQIEQVDISPDHSFDLIPKLGNQVIHFGNVENYRQKFNNLLCFYKQVLSKKGWSLYSSLDLQFAKQIVGIRRDAKEIKTDSLRSVQIMRALIADAQKHTNDSTNIQLEQPEDNNNNINTSTEVENIPDEDVKGNTNADNKNHSSVAPIHVPEKPFFVKQPAVKTHTQTGYSPSGEKSKPATVKKQVIKPPVLKPLQSTKEKPKAIMPPKTDY
ncbi:MAG: FtsQ-type POTRA domain-containing protein [Ginsengibacter sp.]